MEKNKEGQTEIMGTTGRDFIFTHTPEGLEVSFTLRGAAVKAVAEKQERQTMLYRIYAGGAAAEMIRQIMKPGLVLLISGYRRNVPEQGAADIPEFTAIDLVWKEDAVGGEEHPPDRV